MLDKDVSSVETHTLCVECTLCINTFSTYVCMIIMKSIWMAYYIT